MSFSFTIPNTPPTNKTTNPPAFNFGATTNTPSTTTGSNAPFSFGAQPTASSSSAGSGSAFQFGSSTTPSFGSNNNQTGNVPTQQTSIFGSSQQQPQSSGFSFGSNQPATSTTVPSFSLNQPSATPSFSLNQPSTGSSFSLNQPSANLSSGTSNSIFGFGSSSNAMNIPQIAATPAPFPRDTKFSELPQELKSSLEQLEKTIRENSSKLMLIPPSSSNTNTTTNVDFESKINQVQALLDSRRETLRELRRKMNYYWRYAESTAQALLASKSQTTDGRVIYKVPPMTPGLDPLERSVEELEAQVATLTRLGTVAKRRLESLMSPPRPLEETVPATLKAQVQALTVLSKKMEEMERSVGEEKEKYQMFVRKYRNFYQDPFTHL